MESVIKKWCTRRGDNIMFGNKSHFTRLVKWGNGVTQKDMSRHTLWDSERKINTHAHTRIHSFTHVRVYKKHYKQYE